MAKRHLQAWPTHHSGLDKVPRGTNTERPPSRRGPRSADPGSEGTGRRAANWLLEQWAYLGSAGGANRHGPAGMATQLQYLRPSHTHARGTDTPFRPRPRPRRCLFFVVRCPYGKSRRARRLARVALTPVPCDQRRPPGPCPRARGPQSVACLAFKSVKWMSTYSIDRGMFFLRRFTERNVSL